MSNSSPGLSYAASYPCICWHFKSALYLVMGYIPRVLRRLIRTVLPPAADINLDLSVTHIWLDLICYRKATHSYMRLFQALLGKSGYFQPGFALKAAAEHWLSQVDTALGHLPV